MKKKDKELLLKDLCARLPYGVKCEDERGNVLELSSIEQLNNIDKQNVVTFRYSDNTYNTFWVTDLDKFKPYLFPMTNITKRQAKKYYSLADDVVIPSHPGYSFGMKIHCIKLGISDSPHEEVWDWVDMDAIDWLNAKHFDYRGLIKKGLAIDATGKNIY